MGDLVSQPSGFILAQAASQAEARIRGLGGETNKHMASGVGRLCETGGFFVRRGNGEAVGLAISHCVTKANLDKRHVRSAAGDIDIALSCMPCHRLFIASEPEGLFWYACAKRAICDRVDACHHQSLPSWQITVTD